MKSRIADPTLAPSGERSHHWASDHMPALTRIIEKLSSKQPLKERRIGVCLHVTKETSVLVQGLVKLGGEVSLCAANPLSTQDDIAAFLASKGVSVYAWRGETGKEYDDCIKTMLDSQPQIVMDDGADVHVALHKDQSYTFPILGGTEETTTGVLRLKALEKTGRLRYPIVAVNNAYTKYLFDNRYGTGQSTLDGILRASSLLIAGKRVVVCGYGWVGKGIAKRARGFDAHVTVTEVDPWRALEAHMDGYEVMPIQDAASEGDIFVTATGQTGVIRGEHMEQMKDGAVLSNAGHFDVEVDVKYLETNKVEKRNVRPHTDEYVLKSGKRLYLIGQGRVVNLVAAEGHPPEVMMMSFSNQLLSAIYISENHAKLEKKLLAVPESIDRNVAESALEALSIRIDEPTEEQLKYAQSWIL